MSHKDTICNLRKEHPDWTLRQIANEIGVTPQYVSHVLMRHGLSTWAIRKEQTETESSPEIESSPEKIDRGPTLNWSASGQTKLGKGDIGTITELLVCCDLVRQGHDVYRAVNMTSPADLIVYANGNALRVEVKAAQIRGKQWIYGSGKHGHYEVLALVAPTGEIRYRPSIEVAKHKKRA